MFSQPVLEMNKALGTEGKCLFSNRQVKYYVYVNLGIATDTMFPLPLGSKNKRYVKVYFNDKKQLIIEKWPEKAKE